MAELFHELLVSCPNGGGMFLLHKGASYKLDGLDTTGFDVCGKRIVRAIQPASLVLFHASAREFAGRQANIDDLHDAFFDDDSCYVVSTSGNEVVQLDFNGQEQQRWTFPGEIDAWHVNSITRWNERIVFSAFADRTGRRSYKDPPFEVGFVQDLETGDRRITELFQPHSLTPDGNHLLLANSGAFEVHAYDSSGKLLRRLRLEGYTRGLARQGKVLYVGLSKSRNVDTENLPGATIVALDAATWEELGRVRLPVDEIYGIKSVRGVDAVATLAKIASHASARFAGDFEQTKLKLAGVERIREHLMGQFDAVTRDRDEQSRDSARRIHGLLETVQGKDVQIQNRDQIIRDKDAEVQRRDELIGKKDSDIEHRETKLREKDERLRDSEHRIHGLLETVQGKDVQIQNRDQIIRDKDAEVQRRDELIGKKDSDIEHRETKLREQDERLRDSERRIHGLLETVQGKDVQIQNRDQIIRDKDAEIKTLIDSLLVNNVGLRRLADEMTSAHARTETLAAEVAARDRVIDAIQATLSWRITKPLRALRGVGKRLAASRVIATTLRPVNKASHVTGTLRKTFGDAELRARYLTLARVLGPRAAMRHTLAYLRRGGPRSPIPVPVFDLRERVCRKAVILTTRHCDFVAASIRHALDRIGVKAKIIHERPDSGYEDLQHFVICPQMFEHLPGLYVAFQMEQSVSTRWFTPEYVKTLENAFAILDYSIANIDALVEKGLHRKQFFYLPLGYLPDYIGNRRAVKPEYDVLFYGDINNERRRRFVAELEKVCRVKVINDLFGEALHAELAKAKLVVNIHYYEGALLETTRLWECVSLGKLVVSERAVNMDENGDLEKLVDFVDLNDVDGMVERVRYWLANESARQARLKTNRSLAERQANRFEYFFYRFLLAWDLISFYRFWELAGSKLTLGGDKLCLNLPEWTRRRRSFDQDNHYGFEVFPGLRHREGWVGCAMSYKLMIMLACQQGLPSVTICEDDVEFTQGFESRWAAIQKQLVAAPDEWDVFSGLLADLHADAQILSAYKRDDIQFAVTDRLISTVFNVYNATVFDAIASWDERNRDAAINTIDRYLERTGSLRVLTTLPFLAGHKEELYSTLWGFQNTQYVDLIAASNELLANKVGERLGVEGRRSTAQ